MLQQLQPMVSAAVRDIEAEANDGNTSRGKRVSSGGAAGRVGGRRRRDGDGKGTRGGYRKWRPCNYCLSASLPVSLMPLPATPAHLPPCLPHLACRAR